MTKLDSLVERVVESYRTTFAITSILAFVLTAISGNWVGVLVLIPILIGTYFIGLHVLAWVLSAIVSPSVVVEEIRKKRIIEINRRLAEGELEAESEELEEEMRKAGLKPLSIVTERGPILGKQFDVDLYEWVEAKEGLKGSPEKYFYVGQAEFDEDGTVFLENDDEHKKHLVLDGVLYESDSRRTEAGIAAPVGEASSV